METKKSDCLLNAGNELRPDKADETSYHNESEKVLNDSSLDKIVKTIISFMCKNLVPQGTKILQDMEFDELELDEIDVIGISIELEKKFNIKLDSDESAAQTTIIGLAMYANNHFRQRH